MTKQSGTETSVSELLLRLWAARNGEVIFGCVRFWLRLPFVLPSLLLREDAMPDAVPTLSFERVFASPALDGPAPRQVKLSPDGRYLTLLRNRADDRERYDLWGYDIDTREWRMLVDSQALGSGRELSEDEKMQRERARVGSPQRHHQLSMGERRVWRACAAGWRSLPCPA